MTAVVLAHVGLAILAGTTGRLLGRRVLLVGALGPAIAFVWVLANAGTVLSGTVHEESFTWVPALGLGLDLRLDGFGWLFWLLISGIGLAVMLYAVRYFGPRRDLGRLASMLVLFAGSMLLLTSADNLLLVFVAWELTSITSYLLIGFADHETAARQAALQALLVTGIGGLALFGGVVLIGQAADTWSLSAVLASPPTSTPAQVGLALVLFGAFTKSAQAPFHFWLPGAMAAPTPVSAYLHSATMVKGGVYLVARLAPAMAPSVDWWVPVVVGVGAVSMLLGGWRALRANDLKELLAQGTISQLGLMIVLLGAGTSHLTHAGVAVVFAHALFKAALFLAVGVIDHQAGTRYLRRLHGLARRLRPTAVVMAVAGASMAGVLPLLGFVAKEAALEASLTDDVGGLAVTVAIVAGAALTAGYTLRLVWGAFAHKDAEVLLDDHVEPSEVARARPSLDAPGAVLAGASLLFGLWIAPADAIVGAAATSLDTATAELHLATWHGLTPAFGLSLTALALGGLLFWRRDVVARVGELTARVPEARDAYRWSLFALHASADRTTAVVQPGSLPVYAGIVLATAVLLPTPALLRSLPVPSGSILSASGLQIAIGTTVVAAALGTATVRRRLSSVLLLGAVGYGVAILFLLQGAPDLALTQLLIETLALGIFVLVLRHLPRDFEPLAWRPGASLRIVLATAVGIFVGAFALMAASVRDGESAAAEYLARAEPEGGGANVVNVILTDFRALDTLGEITVLVVAAVGVMTLVSAARAQARAEREEEAS